jgi:hypothetical protein
MAETAVKSQKSKLEKEIARREKAEARASVKRLKVEAADESRRERTKRAGERKEFNRLFSRLKRMVALKYCKWGRGWQFAYKGESYYISYDAWVHEAVGVDGYETSGHHWVLKKTDNGYAYGLSCYPLGDGTGKQGLTEEVMRGLRELNDPARYRSSW